MTGKLRILSGGFRAGGAPLLPFATSSPNLALVGFASIVCFSAVAVSASALWTAERARAWTHTRKGAIMMSYVRLFLDKIWAGIFRPRLN